MNGLNEEQTFIFSIQDSDWLEVGESLPSRPLLLRGRPRRLRDGHPGQENTRFNRLHFKKMQNLSPKRYKEKWSSGICLNNPEGHCHTHWTARRSWRCPPASGGWRCPCSTSGGWRAEPWWRPEPAGGGPAAPAPSLHPGCVSARSESGSTAGSWALWCSDAQPGRLRGKDTRHVRQTSCCSKSDPSNVRSSVFSVSYCQVCLWAARCSWCRYRRWSVEVCGGRWSRRAPPSGSCSNQPAAHTTTAPGPPPAPPSSWKPPEPHPETTKQVCLTVGSKRILIEYLFICQLVKETD